MISGMEKIDTSMATIEFQCKKILFEQETTRPYQTKKARQKPCITYNLKANIRKMLKKIMSNGKPQWLA
ncbi:hypothetical protein VNO77_01003 [Canavalia gladiata]|uniref:Uncharacterized protein n=1 Tax=Canavalia gladiata TaxID=3824 RepID=A0AAN9R4K7_CANGL